MLELQGTRVRRVRPRHGSRVSEDGIFSASAVRPRARSTSSTRARCRHSVLRRDAADTRSDAVRRRLDHRCVEIMAADGSGGVKIQRLCEQLGVTKGSFYCTSDDLDAFSMRSHSSGASARDVRSPQWTPQSTRSQAGCRTGDGFLDGRLGRLERAMRDWSRTDDRARAAIKAADKRTFDTLAKGFEHLGFDREKRTSARRSFLRGRRIRDVGRSATASERPGSSRRWSSCSPLAEKSTSGATPSINRLRRCARASAASLSGALTPFARSVLVPVLVCSTGCREDLAEQSRNRSASHRERSSDGELDRTLGRDPLPAGSQRHRRAPLRPHVLQRAAEHEPDDFSLSPDGRERRRRNGQWTAPPSRTTDTTASHCQTDELRECVRCPAYVLLVFCAVMPPSTGTMTPLCNEGPAGRATRHLRTRLFGLLAIRRSRHPRRRATVCLSESPQEVDRRTMSCRSSCRRFVHQRCHRPGRRRHDRRTP